MEIRASDEDRERTVAALEQHAGAGRLTLDEFAERARTAHSARTLDELAAVVQDLPADAQPAGAVAAVAEEPSRDLLVLFAIAAVVLILLGFFIALRS
ncbi:DUF1707 domain-containing protein [Actinoplanes bogorensis]|uniref:DUF1707 domain-containing protein n=1 Tax=Paractinoplanes bogorensis TaxID=1610840 RepID=A0ABS5YZA0_9ACTN|nr:DUF1707 domain-containing protein [Actinoplanes bogorensis]MBU2668708.1 DUF1707 domain-containing protein [Actinoplanes bogorensis]